MTHDNKSNPYVISLEGIDGSGKDTQAQLLSEYLMSNGCVTITRSYPQYSSFFGQEIGKLLSGRRAGASADKLDPQSMALWYALDRWHDYSIFLQGQTAPDVLLFNRYTLSSVVYQGIRSENSIECEDWIFHLEQNVLGLPAPDIYFIFDVGSDTASINVLRKDAREYIEAQTHDVYEGDRTLQTLARESYLKWTERLPNAILLQCVNVDQQMLSPAAIHRLIVSQLEQQGVLDEIRSRKQCVHSGDQ